MRPDLKTVLRRHADHYLNVISKAQLLFRQGGTTANEGLAQFELEWTNIQLGQTWAANHADRDEMATLYCSRYSESGNVLLNLRRHTTHSHWLISFHPFVLRPFHHFDLLD